MKIPKAKILLGLALAFIYLLACFRFRLDDFWRTHFFTSGFTAFVYELNRSVFFIAMNLVLLTSGELVLGKAAAQEPPAAPDFDLARLIRAFFTGSALFTVAGGLLAEFQLLRFPLLAVITAPLAGLSPFILKGYARSFLNTLRSSGWKFPASLCLLLVAFELAYLFLVKGLPPDRYTIDSLGHYLPYYQRIFDNGGLVWPTEFYINYFFLKGAGVQLVFGALSDVNVMQTISFMFLAHSGLLLLYWLKELFGKRAFLYALPFLLLLFANPFVLMSEFQKIHVMDGAFFLYVIFFTTRWFEQRTDRRVFLLEIFVGAAFAFLNPAFMIFVALLLSLQLGSALLDRNRAVGLRIFKFGACIFLTLAFICALNFARTGMVDVTPISIAEKLSDPARRPPGILMLSLRYFMLDEGSVKPTRAQTGALTILDHWAGDLSGQLFSLGKVPDYISRALLAALVLALLASSRGRSAGLPGRRTFRVHGALFIVLLLLKEFMVQASFFRSLTFLPLIKLYLLVAAVHVLFKTVFTHENKRFSRNELAAAFLLLAAAAAASQAMLRQLTKERLLPGHEFAAGEKSFADYYGFKPDSPCTEARKAVGKGPRITLLHFSPDCVGKPTDNLDYLDPSNFAKGSEVFLLQRPGEARRNLIAAGVNHFVYAPGNSMYIFGFYPLFQPDSVWENFKIERVLTYAYLLTWRAPGDEKLNSNFMREYSATVARDKLGPNYPFFSEWVGRRNKGDR